MSEIKLARLISNGAKKKLPFLQERMFNSQVSKNLAHYFILLALKSLRSRCNGDASLPSKANFSMKAFLRIAADNKISQNQQQSALVGRMRPFDRSKMTAHAHSSCKSFEN